MNHLTRSLLEGLLEEDKKVVALYGGGFKPPIGGHFEVVDEALKQYPEIDELIILVGGGERNGISQAEAILIWEIYQDYLPPKVKIQPSKMPIGDIYSFAKNNPQDIIYWIIGRREGADDDNKDIIDRAKALKKNPEKYNNLDLKVITTQDESMRGRNSREAAKKGKLYFTPFLPKKLSKEDKSKVFDIVSPVLKENATYSQNIDYKQMIQDLTDYMIKKGRNIEPLPKVEFVDGDSENAKDFFGKTAYYDPNTQTIVLYTEGRHPKDIVRSFSHEMVHHTQFLEDRLGDVQTTNTTEDDNLDKIEQEANLVGTMTFRNWTDNIKEKKNKDPFGLNAYAYELALGLEEEIINEGVYDSLVTRLTNLTIKKWIADYKADPKLKQSFIDIDIDEEDSKGRPIEFNYVGRLIFDKKVDGYEVDGTSNSGEEEDKIPFIAALFTINPSVLPNAWSKISADVSDVIRHEIEHLTQAGDNVRTGKYKDDDIQIRDMINKLKLLPYKNYYLLDKEVDAMLQGLYLKAKKTKKPFADVINNYLNIAPGLENKEDKEMVLDLWRRRRKALSLPVFENEEKVMDYKIHLDMDGVITDFNSQFEELTGMMPNDFESKYGIKGFWEAIDKAGVGFWRGMKWMPDGEELYNKVSQFDHELLSSPSRGDSSKIGKRLWRRDKTPNTKLTLAYSANKKNYAAPNHILIDDRADNINQWKNAGGIGILHTSTASTLAKLKELGL